MYNHMTGNDLLFRVGSFVNSVCVSSSIKLCNQDKNSWARQIDMHLYEKKWQSIPVSTYRKKVQILNNKKWSDEPKLGLSLSMTHKQ